MKGKLVFVLCLLLLTSCLSFAGFGQLETRASSGFPVHNLSTGLNYATIQAAVDANETLSGQTILVDDGTYYENVIVNKSLTLIGEDKDNTIVDGNSSGPAFNLHAQNVSLVNFTATNPGVPNPPVQAAVDLVNVSNCLIEDLDVINSDSGINLVYSTHNQISNCGLFKNKYLGIWLGDSDENTISNNVVSGNNEAGIGLGGSGCNNNLMIDNQVSFTIGHAFDIVGINNTITSNQIWNNTDGILLDMANCTLVNGNNISNNTEYGVWLIDGAENNTFFENTIQNNWVGISGLYTDWESGSNNMFYHNNILGNMLQLIMPPDSLNVWDNGYPSGGNYWSDYNGTDLYNGQYQNVTGSDGIGDKPYTANALLVNVTDRYPLMGLFSNFNATPQYSVQTVCNSTISDFQLNNTAISFTAVDVDGTTGFCRICVPTALINGTYRVFVNGTQVPYTLLPFSNSTSSYLYLNYTQVVIVPEFQTFLVLTAFIIVAMSAIVAYGKKSKKILSALRSEAHKDSEKTSIIEFWNT